MASRCVPQAQLLSVLSDRLVLWLQAGLFRHLAQEVGKIKVHSKELINHSGPTTDTFQL